MTVVLALVFAAIGCVEFATGHLLITNAKVVEANDLLPYFRVNSLFFDPNIYGRYLALTMILLATVLLWTRRRREAILIACALALLWAGLVFSLSQSSFAALLLGLARARGAALEPVAGAGRRRRGRRSSRSRSCSSPPACSTSRPAARRSSTGSTSGRANLIGGGARMVRDRPLWGYGSGAFTEQYRERERVSSEKVAAASHTIPLTVTAEQGVIGLAAYLALVAVSLALLFRGLRAAVGSAPWPGVVAVARAGIAAAYAALLAAHARVRGVPRGPADLGPARDRGEPARGAAGGPGRRERRRIERRGPFVHWRRCPRVNRSSCPSSGRRCRRSCAAGPACASARRSRCSRPPSCSSSLAVLVVRPHVDGVTQLVHRDAPVFNLLYDDGALRRGRAAAGRARAARGPRADGWPPP